MRLHGLSEGGPANKQILKAPKRGTPYAEYWPEPADAEIITLLVNNAEKIEDGIDALAIAINGEECQYIERREFATPCAKDDGPYLCWVCRGKFALAALNGEGE